MHERNGSERRADDERSDAERDREPAGPDEQRDDRPGKDAAEPVDRVQIPHPALRPLQDPDRENDEQDASAPTTSAEAPSSASSTRAGPLARIAAKPAASSRPNDSSEPAAAIECMPHATDASQNASATMIDGPKIPPAAPNASRSRP